MRILAALCLLLLPATAQAQFLGQKELNRVGDECMASCQHDQSFEACSNICQCVTNTVARDWTRVEYEAWGEWMKNYGTERSLEGAIRACKVSEDLT
jgi:hypothetical protein